MSWPIARLTAEVVSHSPGKVSVMDFCATASSSGLIILSLSIPRNSLSTSVRDSLVLSVWTGAMTMYGRTLHDDHSDHFGVVTVQYALEHSSDVGAAKMALKLGNQKFYDYIKGFGLRAGDGQTRRNPR